MDYKPTGFHVGSLAQLARRGRWHAALPHTRPVHLLVWVTRGQIRALCDGARHGIGLNTALFVPAGALVALDLDRQVFGQAVTLPAGAPSSGLGCPDRPAPVRLRTVAAQTSLAGLVDALAAEIDSDLPHRSAALAAHAALMAVWLHRQIRAEADLRPRDSAARRLCRAYFERLAPAQAGKTTMAAHADALGVTPTHLSRVCRRETGRTAAGLLADRMEHAARCDLVATDRPIGDIARRLGFASPAGFSRFLHQRTGVSPTALRRTAPATP
jgi:AraC family transcriptional activator of pobA